MDKDPVIIVGGGLQGLATANSLLDRGEKVLVLEKEEGVALKTSFANAGQLTPSHSQPWNSVSDILNILKGIGKKDSPMSLKLGSLGNYFGWGIRFILNSFKSKYEANTKSITKLAQHSLKLTKQFREDNAIEYDCSQIGTLKIYRSKKSFDAAIEHCKKLKKMGINSEVLTTTHLIEKEPQLAEIEDQLEGGIYFQDDEVGDAHKFCKELADVVRSKGGRILTNVEIKELMVDQNSIKGVKTDRAEINSEKVIISAGSWSYLLLKGLNLRLPVRPVKGYSLTIETPPLNSMPKLALVDEDIHTAITPFSNSRIRVTAAAELAGFDEQIHEKRVSYLKRMLNSVYPSLYSQLDVDEGKLWFGFRPMSPDGLPFIGETKISGLYLNTGQGHLGWTLAMGSADLCSDIVLENKTAIDPHPYRITR